MQKITLLLLSSLLLLSTAYADSQERWNKVFPDMKGWSKSIMGPYNSTVNDKPHFSIDVFYTKGKLSIGAGGSRGVHIEDECLLSQAKIEPEREETDDRISEFILIQGFQTHFIYNKKTEAGTFDIELQHAPYGEEGARGGMSFNKLTYEEAIKTVNLFDWKKIADEMKKK